MGEGSQKNKERIKQQLKELWVYSQSVAEVENKED